ncbi:hypothetical protein AgCh_033867 [Apium graveolens]
MTLKEFLEVAAKEVASVQNLYTVAGSNADALALYFNEDPVRCPFEQDFATKLMSMDGEEKVCYYNAVKLRENVQESSR